MADALSLGNGVYRAATHANAQGDAPLRKTALPEQPMNLIYHGCRNHRPVLPRNRRIPAPAQVRRRLARRRPTHLPQDVQSARPVCGPFRLQFSPHSEYADYADWDPSGCIERST
jgi:hypothetical protein